MSQTDFTERQRQYYDSLSASEPGHRFRLATEDIAVYSSRLGDWRDAVYDAILNDLVRAVDGWEPPKTAVGVLTPIVISRFTQEQAALYRKFAARTFREKIEHLVPAYLQYIPQGIGPKTVLDVVRNDIAAGLNHFKPLAKDYAAIAAALMEKAEPVAVDPEYAAGKTIYFKPTKLRRYQGGTAAGSDWDVIEGRDVLHNRGVNASFPRFGIMDGNPLFELLLSDAVIRLNSEGTARRVSIPLNRQEDRIVDTIACSAFSVCPIIPFQGRLSVTEDDNGYAAMRIVDGEKSIDIPNISGHGPVNVSTRADAYYTVFASEDCQVGDKLEAPAFDVGNGAKVVFDSAVPDYDKMRQYVRRVPEDLIISPSHLFFENKKSAMALRGVVAHGPLTGREIVVATNRAQVENIRHFYDAHEKPASGVPLMTEAELRTAANQQLATQNRQFRNSWQAQAALEQIMLEIGGRQAGPKRTRSGRVNPFTEIKFVEGFQLLAARAVKSQIVHETHPRGGVRFLGMYNANDFRVPTVADVALAQGPG